MLKAMQTHEGETNGRSTYCLKAWPNISGFNMANGSLGYQLDEK